MKTTQDLMTRSVAVLKAAEALPEFSCLDIDEKMTVCKMAADAISAHMGNNNMLKFQEIMMASAMKGFMK